MRYSETHKSETREKLLKIAGRTLREKGPENLAVADVMREAGPDPWRLLRALRLQGGAAD